ncbi:Flp pilus assembly protein CpaB [Maritalea sp.]|uniref:Flp pilus assembly protein CpaB n=1 Tax=Maritalea sp. TaxID=2003361 RepID=UPI003EF0AF52
MKPARILLLAVALCAGGLAAFFALNSRPSGSDSEQVAEPVVERTRVLIATRTIGIGERLSSDMLGWQSWPEDGIRSEFVTDRALPDAISQLDGVVARFEIFVGEPVREAKLVRADQGYLSAVIGKGMRGVSITVSAESGAGGFIVPNDRVDVIVTQPSEFGEVSQTVLTNARVLAIGQRIGEKGETGENTDQDVVFDEDTIATLELTPAQSEIIVNALKVGELSLTLRSIVDFADGPATDALSNNSTIQFIRAGRSTSARTSVPPAADLGVVSNTPQPIFSQRQNDATRNNAGARNDGGQTPPVLQ